jgi:hypothetical protein
MKIKNFFKKILQPTAQKEIVLNCYTYLSYAHKYAPIDYAINYAPDWWKKTPARANDGKIATVKSCVSVLDYLKSGIVIPSWFEMDVNLNSKSNDNIWYTWLASNPSVVTDNSHSPEQFAGFAGAGGKNLKITSPWKFTTEEEIYFSWTQPTWHHRELMPNVFVLPGVLNFKFQNATEINLFVINKETEETFTIPSLIPLAILHPLTERKVIIKNHLITKEEWDNMLGPQALVLHRHSSDLTYKKRKNKLKQIEERTCPYKDYE